MTQGLVDHLGRPMTGKRYAAARPTRLGETWRPTERDINTMISRSAPVIRARTSQLIRDFPYFVSALRNVVNKTVGPGLRFQARVRTPDGALDRRLNQHLEDEFKFWADEADIRGLQHFYEQMRFAHRQDTEMGEYICVRTHVKTPGRRYPLALTFYESAWLTSDGAMGADGNPLLERLPIQNDTSEVAIQDGIEYSRFTGEILAYHLREPGSSRRPRRIPASHVMHGMDVLRGGQFRGVSPFAPAILVAHSLQEYMGAELDAAQMASKWLGFVTRQDSFGTPWQGPQGRQKDRRLEIENAIMEYLDPGEEVNFTNPNRPGNQFDPFTRLVLRMVAVTLGVSYESLSGDYGDVNYSTLKGIRNDEQEAFCPHRNRVRHQFCRPAGRWFMDDLFLSGRVPLPGYLTDRHRYLRAVWMDPGQSHLEPVKETNADLKAVEGRITSRTRVCAKYGMDFEEVLDELQQEEKMIRDRKLDPEDVDRKLAGLPAGRKGDNVVCLR